MFRVGQSQGWRCFGASVGLTSRLQPQRKSFASHLKPLRPEMMNHGLRVVSLQPEFLEAGSQATHGQSRILDLLHSSGPHRWYPCRVGPYRCSTRPGHPLNPTHSNPEAVYPTPKPRINNGRGLSGSSTTAGNLPSAFQVCVPSQKEVKR